MDRFRHHRRDFHNKKYVNGTKLSKHMLKLKDEKMTDSIKCNVMSIVHGTSKGSVYKLCLTEKF